MKREEQRLATTYARAWYANFGDALTEVEYERLLAVADVLDDQRSLLLFSQVVQNAESSGVLKEYFTQVGYKELFSSLIDLLIQQRRLLLLPQILRSIQGEYLEQEGIIHFTIESAIELTKQEQDKLVSFLKEKTQKEIRYTLKENPALIAGVKIYSDTLGYEHSIQQLLYQL